MILLLANPSAMPAASALPWTGRNGNHRRTMDGRKTLEPISGSSKRNEREEEWDPILLNGLLSMGVLLQLDTISPLPMV